MTHIALPPSNPLTYAHNRDDMSKAQNKDNSFSCVHFKLLNISHERSGNDRMLAQS